VRVLLDACVWGGATAVLRAAGHDVEWVGDWSGDPRAETSLIGRGRGTVWRMSSRPRTDVPLGVRTV
jgi:hypothetical protein